MQVHEGGAPLDPPVSHYEALRQYSNLEAPGVLADIEAANRMKDRLFAVPAELFHSPVVTICSVWPERLTSQPFQHGGVARRVYHIEAGSPENPAYLPIQNSFTRIQSQNSTERIDYTDVPVLAPQIATDLIHMWTGDHVANVRGKKGIGVILGRIKEGGRVEATPEEIRNLVQLQDGFLDFLIERADEFYDNGKREKIKNEHRRALKMRGQDINLHPWYRSKIQLYSSCPYCDEKVSTGSLGCKHCKTDIVKWFMDRNEIPSADSWPRVVKEIDRLTKSADAKKVK